MPPKSNSRRTDPAWKHCVEVTQDSGEGEGGKKAYVYVECKYCQKIIKGGVKRMKDHLGGTHNNVVPCDSAPKEVVLEMKQYLNKFQERKQVVQENLEFLSSRGSYYGGRGSGSGDQEVVSRIPQISTRGKRGEIDRYFAVDVDAANDDVVGGTSREPTRVLGPNAKERRDQTCLDIGRFMFENGLPFNLANSPSFSNMIRSIGEYGRGLKPPSMYELRTWILTKEVETTTTIVNEVKHSWSGTGVSIMSDGWTDIRGRQLINFLVNNPEGTVFLRSIDASDVVKDADMLFKMLDEIVEEVGEDNVVQVVTDNASAYKKAGEMLMVKRPHLYWTPCAAHCIDLMLESLYKLPQLANAIRKAKKVANYYLYFVYVLDFSLCLCSYSYVFYLKVANYIYNHGWVLACMRGFTKRELIRPAATRFATSNLTLQSMVQCKQPLEEMFTSRKWKNSRWATMNDGKAIRKIILKDANFWPSVVYSLKATKPLVGVLRLVDSDKTPAMGFLYGAMDKAKEEIAKNFDNDVAKYKEIWEIIDERWDFRMHRHLHAAAYFLNPQFQYEPNFSRHSEVTTGLYNCMDKLIVDPEEKEQAHLDLDRFRGKQGLFGRDQALTTRFKRTPANWWMAFGDETPALTKFAVRVLSLTCTASGCERNWSTFNQVHTKRRNKLTQQAMNALVFVMYNKKLKIKQLQRRIKIDKGEDPLVVDEIDSDDDWVAEGESSGIRNGVDNLNLAELDVEALQREIALDDVNDEIDRGGRGRNVRGRSSNPRQSRGGTSGRRGGRGANLARRAGKGPRIEVDEDEEEEWMDIEGEDVGEDSPPIRYDDDSLDDPTSDDDNDVEGEGYGDE